MVGVAGHSATGKAFPTYQRVWIGLVQRGILVIAIDPPGQGERYEYWDSELGRSAVGGPTAEHSMAGIQCLLSGTNFARSYRGHEPGRLGAVRPSFGDRLHWG